MGWTQGSPGGYRLGCRPDGQIQRSDQALIQNTVGVRDAEDISAWFRAMPSRPRCAGDSTGTEDDGRRQEKQQKPTRPLCQDPNDEPSYRIVYSSGPRASELQIIVWSFGHWIR